MANMSPKRNPMPTQDPKVRARNFNEVATGYTEQMAIDEAMRCLNCKNMPCVSGCPVNIHIPEFIGKIKEGDFEGAYQIISRTSSLPAVCGRVCPQENQCEAKCVRGIKGESVGIGRLERFVADWHNAHSDKIPEVAEKCGHKVAVIGSGPSGLTCAGDLAKSGFDVTVFEALHTAGGVLVYGIPEFRLPKAIVKKEVDNLKAMGVEFMTNVIIGKTLTVDELKTFVKLLCPFAPHIAEELWHRLGEESLVSLAAWPTYDEAKTVDNTVTIAVAVMGKTKDTVEIPKDADEDTAFAAAIASEKVANLIAGKQIVKKIYVKNKIFNLIVK